MRERVVIFGSSDHARVVIDVTEKEGRYVIAGLIGVFKDIGEEVMGYKILGSEDNLLQIVKEKNVYGGLIAIGDNYVRLKVYKKIVKIIPDFKFVTVIHPSVQIGKNVQIGGGTMIMAGVVVNPCSVIGQHCILNTNASLDHDCVMDNFSSLAPNVATGGNVQVGECTAIGLGASISNNIVIKEHTVIGTGSVVVKDIPEFVVAYGVPAKAMRTREVGEKYM